MSDWLGAFLVEHRLCSTVPPHFVSESTVDDETFPLTCRGCGAGLELPAPTSRAYGSNLAEAASLP